MTLTLLLAAWCCDDIVKIIIYHILDNVIFGVRHQIFISAT